MSTSSPSLGFPGHKVRFPFLGQDIEVSQRPEFTSRTLRISLAWEVMQGASPAPGPCRTWSAGPRAPSGSPCHPSAPPPQLSGSGGAAWPDREVQVHRDVRGTGRRVHRRGMQSPVGPKRLCSPSSQMDRKALKDRRTSPRAECCLAHSSPSEGCC